MESKYNFNNLEDLRKVKDLYSWTQDYLRGPGHNKKLANHISQAKNVTVTLIEMPLDSLVLVAGPSKDFHFPINPDQWEVTVSEYTKMIKSGWNPPPLIVTEGIFDNRNSVSDGTHRLEALRRCGFDRYWVLFVKKTN